MNRIMSLLMKRMTVRNLLLTAGIITWVLVLFTARPAVAAPTLPVLWTAGGLDAGNTGAGQAARIATDSSGNVAVVSGPALATDLAVTSYTAAGTFRWRNMVSPSVGTFGGDWVAAAPNGDFVAVGRNYNASGNPIAITMVRFGSDGTLLWRVDLARTLPYVARLLVDAGGNTYLAFNSLGDGQDIQLHKYSPSGTLLWSQVINTGFLAFDIATSLALSPDETELALSGDVSGGATWITALYEASTGALNWLVTAPEGTAALDVVMDADRVYVTGQAVTNPGTPAMEYHLAVVAYDRATGAKLWRTDKNPADGTNSTGLRMAMTPDGNLVVTGQTLRGFLDWYTVAFETNGTVLWEAVRDGGLNTDEIPAAVLVLPDGTAVVTGRGGPALPGGYWPGVTVGYSSNGTLLWEAFSLLPTVWATTLPSGDVCATGGYDALITCWDVDNQQNTPPVAVAAANPTSGDAPLTVNFSSAGSHDPDGSIVGYAWDFGDGGVSTEANPVHTFTSGGIFPATLTVTDNLGATGSDEVIITVTETGCTSNCLMSRKIMLKASGTSQVNVRGQVLVKDENGLLVSNAQVFISWTLPNGDTIIQNAPTNAGGKASFQVTGTPGTFTLTVDNITKNGFLFDPEDSVLMASITK